MKRLSIFIYIAILIMLASACSSSKKVTTSMAEPEKVETVLVGDLNYADIITTFPRWAEQDKQAELNPAEVEQLSKVARKIEVVCYLGTWCSDSRGAVPQFTRSLELAENPNISYRIIGLNRDKDDPPAHLALQNDIQRVPTFVIYENEAEIGRLIEYPVQENFVLDILELLSSK